MLKNVQTCTFSLLWFHGYSNISAYLGSLQGKRNILRQMVKKTESRTEGDKRGQCGFSDLNELFSPFQQH